MSVNNLTFSDGNPPPCDADFLNSVKEEVNNTVTQSGQSLTGIGDTSQLSKGIANYVSSSAFYSCTNTGDAYTLTPISPFKGITGYKDGQLFRFRPSATNTTQSPTANFNSQGVKSITKADGSTQVDIGQIDLNEDIELRYDLANDVLVIPKLGTSSLFHTWATGGIKTENDSSNPLRNIKFNIGSCRDAADTFDIVFSSALVKQLDAVWAAGTGLGGRASAVSLTANTTYHLFVISKVDGTTDAGFDTSLSASNLLSDATGYTKYRRVGSMRTDSSSNWLQYYQQGKRFILKASILDLNYVPASNNYPTLSTISTPLGIITTAICECGMSGTTNSTHGVTSAFVNDASQTVLGETASDQNFIIVYVDTNTSSQINEGRTATAGGSYTFTLRVLGWIDALQS